MGGMTGVRRGVRGLLLLFAGAVVALMVAGAAAAASTEVAESGGVAYVALTPERILDSRNDVEGDFSSPVGARTSKSTSVVGVGGVPAEATAVVINVTAVDATQNTFVTVYPKGSERPEASTLNPRVGGVIANEIIAPVGDDGQVQVYNHNGEVDVLFDVVGYFQPVDDGGVSERLDALESTVTALQAASSEQQGEIDVLEGTVAGQQGEIDVLEGTVAGQQATIDELQALLDGVERDGDTLRFAGMNLQVVNNTGTTDGTPNGLGNVIIGYDSERSTDSDKSGSHYLVIGDSHNYTASGGIVAGLLNTASGDWASVTGGTGNTASGSNSSVSGGESNTASSVGSSVSGGNENTASGFNSSVSGGLGNTASGNDTTVSGGESNTASGARASVSGGTSNLASGLISSVSGGSNNTSSSGSSSVSGGFGNLASDFVSSVSGGSGNTASGARASVSGGFSNTADGIRASILGGNSNTVSTTDGCQPACQ